MEVVCAVVYTCVTVLVLPIRMPHIHTAISAAVLPHRDVFYFFCFGCRVEIVHAHYKYDVQTSQLT